jgi:intracellular septation protein A
MRVPLHILVLQLLPILVFLFVDAFVEDPAWAIGAPLLFVAFQTVLTWMRKKKLDAFILVDALLIGGMGAVSLITRDELFFKLKPAIIEGIMVPYLLFLALAPDRTLTGYFERYATGLSIPSSAFGVMRKLLLWMSAGVAVHAVLSVVAALVWSRQAWAWVSGPGFYLLLVPFAVWVIVRRVRLRRMAAQSGRRRIRARQRQG